MTTIEKLDARTGLTPRMSENEFEAWALRTNTPAEWANGEVLLMSPASEEHVEIVHWLQTLLGMYVAKHRLGRVMATEFMVRLGDSGAGSRIFCSSAREARQFLPETYLDGAPDLAIGAASPGKP